MSDHHNAKDASARITYTHRLGRPLQPGNAGVMRFGSEEYATLHRAAWAEAFRVLRPGGLFVLNVKDFLSLELRFPVCAWHRGAALAAGFLQGCEFPVSVPGMRYGSNRERIDHEMVYTFRKPKEKIDTRRPAMPDYQKRPARRTGARP